MSLFEYLSIAFSLVFSFAAIRLVAGLPHALVSTQRYYVHLSHVFLVLFATITLFWAFWSLRDLEWNFFRFLLSLAGPGLMYFLACTLIPDEPSSVNSWHRYFYDVRRRYFVGLCLLSVCQMTNATVLLEMPLFHPFRVVHVFIFTIGAVGAATDNPLAQRIIAIGGWVVAGFAGILLLLPGALAA
jgi:hypothetical protein